MILTLRWEERHHNIPSGSELRRAYAWLEFSGMAERIYLATLQLLTNCGSMHDNSSHSYTGY